jgi:pimeloyl-ACP methyl ester carboxylesterase
MTGPVDSPHPHNAQPPLIAPPAPPMGPDGLPPALRGMAPVELDAGATLGRITFYAAAPEEPAEAAPLLLVHSINAAGSAREIAPLFEHYRSRRPVYALDLPGFGLSERSDRPYTPRLMTDALHAMLGEIRRLHGAVPVDALALSLSCEFLARPVRRWAFRPCFARCNGSGGATRCSGG